MCDCASLSRISPTKIRTYLSYPQVPCSIQALFLQPAPAGLDLSSPTVLMGLRKGMRPKLYWKTPRPWKRGREMPMIFCSRFWTRRSKVPEVFSTWLNRLFSPKEKIGTSAALEGHRGGSMGHPERQGWKGHPAGPATRPLTFREPFQVPTGRPECPRTSSWV